MSKIIFYPFFVSMIFLARRAGKLHPAPSSAAHGIRFLKAHYPMEFWFRLLSRSKPNETHTLNSTNNETRKKEKKGHIPFVICGKIFLFFSPFLRHCSIYIALSPFYYCIVLSVCLFVAG